MISIQETILRLLIGAIIGGSIGFEREIHGRAAGFRTQLIVCVAGVLIMILSENYYYHFQITDPAIRFQIDPARIAAGALIGIGFLGAGVIVKSGFAIRGLTTAASIWIVSAIGLAIGAGLYLEGIITALITIIALVVLRKVEKRISTLIYRTITVSTRIAENAEDAVTSVLSEHGINIHSIDYEKNQAAGELIYSFYVSTRNKNMIKEIYLKLSSLEFIKTIKVSSFRMENTT